MRQIYLVVLAVLVIVAALLVANFRTINRSEDTGKSVVLTNLPVGYCPSQAEVYRNNRVGGSSIMSVTSCRSVSLTNSGLTNGEEIIVKLPKALAFSLTYSDKVDNYLVALRVGDVTSDNIIDEKDEELVIENLFTSNSEVDLDLDGSITVKELSLVRINKGVGKTRSDQRSWRL